MVFSYFPGCTLKTKGKDLDIWGRASADALGFRLEELPDWQCCGAVYPMAKDEIATRLSSVRALNAAGEQGRELVTLCSACHHVIKRVNNDLKTDGVIRDRVNRYLKLDIPYEGQTNVLHYLEVLRDRIGFAELSKKVVNPLKGRKIGAYYGCLLLRPGKEMGFDDPENPTIIEDFIRAIGADPVVGQDQTVVTVDGALDAGCPGERVVRSQEHRADTQQVFCDLFAHRSSPPW